MNFIRKMSRSLKRVVLGDDDDDFEFEGRSDSGSGFDSSGRRRGRARARNPPVVESAVSDLSGIAHGGVQGLSWVEEMEKVDEDGDVADGFIVCEEDDRGAAGTPKTKTASVKGKTKKKKK